MRSARWQRVGVAALAAVVAVLVGTLALGPGSAPAADPIPSRDSFDHADHEGLFPRCAACHRGAAQPGRSMWPVVADCARCHDGDEHDLVSWTPPDGTAISNVRFDHELHADEGVRCVECHSSDAGDAWNSLRRAVAGVCLDCHGASAAHFDADDDECATCHRPLAEATRLTREDVAGFPRPPSHAEPDFGSRHGALATAGTAAHPDVAASCATCHARNFCLDCHVDGPEQTIIQGLAPDERSDVQHATLGAPPTHGGSDFLRTHGWMATSEGARCATCHTQESCRTCHVGTPGVASSLHEAGPGRGMGARVARRAPESHDDWFREKHGFEANASPETCAGCHARDDCYLCHRPNAGSLASYHPPDFLSRHPAEAYGRTTSCADCHNPQSFCAACHEGSGLVSRRERLGAGYHDGQSAFLFGHGQAARQSLESCVSCHSERDCLLCHGAAQTGGRGFNPHGPGFDAERLRERAPQMCTVCHGAAIPGAR